MINDSLAPRPPVGRNADLISDGFVHLAPGWLWNDPSDGAEKEAWEQLRQSWNDLPLDDYMADGGRYRRRRYAAFHLSGERICRLPHQAHYQHLDHNPLNGGVERWFAPVRDDVAALAPFRRAMTRTAALIAGDDTEAGDCEVGDWETGDWETGNREARGWDVEVHQFRILASADRPGLPTPEGMHRDGRDWVLILFMGADGIKGGETLIEDNEGHMLKRFTLAASGEAVVVNDHAVRHGTSPVRSDGSTPMGYRDMLVITFSRSKK